MKTHSIILVIVMFGNWFLVSKIENAQGKEVSSEKFSKSNFFHVRSFAGGPSSQKVLDLCDSLRNELQRVWSSKVDSNSWEPRCEVIVHRSRYDYSKAVGQGSNSTNGSSLVQLNKTGVAMRRIDLLLDSHGALTSLPHELTHVFLADHFNGRQPPLWLDEGIAMLADTHEKQFLHERDCLEAISSKNALAIEQLVRLDQINSPNQAAAFYGQSLTLVRMLALRKNPRLLIEFANDSIDMGITAALKRHYEIVDLSELERQWKIDVHSFQRISSRMPFVTIRIQP